MLCSINLFFPTQTFLRGGGPGVILLENGAGAFLGGNSRIPFDSKLGTYSIGSTDHL